MRAGPLAAGNQGTRRRVLGGRGSSLLPCLGWSSRDLFGLHSPPTEPHPNRLSRYDEPDLIWLLQGRKVTALTESTAAIENTTVNITVYRKDNKPGLGPLGDSLDDFN